MSDVTENGDLESFKKTLEGLEEKLEEEVFESIEKVIISYEKLEKMTSKERLEDIYNLTVSYNLIVLCASYDASIKSIYMNHLLEKLQTSKQSTKRHIEEIYNLKIFTKRFTNLKQSVIKNNLNIKAPSMGEERKVHQAITRINDMIETRNKIAHEVNHDIKGHNDLKEAIEAVLIYLKWFDTKVGLELED